MCSYWVVAREDKGPMYGPHSGRLVKIRFIEVTLEFFLNFLGLFVLLFMSDLLKK